MNSTVAASIKANLTPDLLRPQYRNSTRPTAGHCYVATEAYYHLTGKAEGFRPMFISHAGAPHWFLSNGQDVIDLTAEQFETPVPHHLAKGKGFLTLQPSKRAKILIERVTNDC